MPPLRDDIDDTMNVQPQEGKAGEKNIHPRHTQTTLPEPANAIDESTPTKLGDPRVSFSHVQLYVDYVEDVSVYKELEEHLNHFSSRTAPWNGNDRDAGRNFWTSIVGSNNNDSSENLPFESQNRDVVKQLLAGFGFRVTGARMPSSVVHTNTRSVLVTSRDPVGVQLIVTSLSTACSATNCEKDEFNHFDAENMRRFLDAHANRQGCAVLAFQVTSVDAIHQRYLDKHPKLLLDRSDYDEGKVLEVFAYYQGDTNDSDADVGTVLRFVEPSSTETTATKCLLPGLTPVEATFDNASQAAYCDHWVSNVNSRVGFLSTLEETLGFTPKVDFNAGVVAAGEAQIESTVTGNEPTSILLAGDKEGALRDQSQVYLPINNALSDVGHVHGFLNEIGQGIQHIASRVVDLVGFVERANAYRDMIGEGFTFLRIPRSYYGILTTKQLVDGISKGKEESEDDNNDDQPMYANAVLTEECAEAVMDACERCRIVSEDFSVDLSMTAEDISNLLESNLAGCFLEEYCSKKKEVVEIILRSRYTNLYSLLQDHLSEASYLGIVRNQILVDVQGEDLLYQIFTSNILQRQTGEEAPFFEFIQRVCSECKDETTGCPTTAKVKPGCGGFGIRNFLTLFLSIEVSKAMMDAMRATDQAGRAYAQEMIDCFTNQLNESNPILTQISDVMTMEGNCKEAWERATKAGDIAAAEMWKSKMQMAANEKKLGNKKLMECSSKYKARMRAIREHRKFETAS